MNYLTKSLNLSLLLEKINSKIFKFKSVLSRSLLDASRGKTLVRNGPYSFTSSLQNFQALSDLNNDPVISNVISILRLSPSSTVLDIGANIGVFSIVLSRSFDESRFYCFEPITSTYS